MKKNAYERFMSKVKEDKQGCWLWQAGKNACGYGQFSDRINGVAHRWIYEILIGSIPGGKQLDHSCRKRACVNPAHLSPVDQATNLHRRRYSFAVEYNTQCRNGHTYAIDGTYTYTRKGREYKKCKACQDNGTARYYARKLGYGEYVYAGYRTKNRPL